MEPRNSARGLHEDRVNYTWVRPCLDCFLYRLRLDAVYHVVDIATLQKFDCVDLSGNWLAELAAE